MQRGRLFPLGAGFRWAVDMPQTQPGDTVVILGPGQRGLASVVACREGGAGDIIVTGLAAEADKFKVAKAFGANYCIEVEDEDAGAGCRATRRVGCPFLGGGLVPGTCFVPCRLRCAASQAASSSHLLMDKVMKSLENVSDGL